MVIPSTTDRIYLALAGSVVLLFNGRGGRQFNASKYVSNPCAKPSKQNSMKARLALIFLTISALTSCNSGGLTNMPDNSDFKVEKSYPNGNPEIVSKQFNDTSVNGRPFSFSFKRQLDTLGQIEREGYYLNDQAFGLHEFYHENTLTVKREYILLSSENIKFLMVADSVTSESLSPTNTYLNSVCFLDKNDTIESKSSFCKITAQTSMGTKDSLRTYIEFFEAQMEIIYLDLYFDVPGDTSLVRVIQYTGKSLQFSQPVIKQRVQTISGFAFLYGYTIDKNAYDTLAVSRMIHFKRDFELN